MSYKGLWISSNPEDRTTGNWFQLLSEADGDTFRQPREVIAFNQSGEKVDAGTATLVMLDRTYLSDSQNEKLEEGSQSHLQMVSVWHAQSNVDDSRTYFISVDDAMEWIARIAIENGGGE